MNENDEVMYYHDGHSSSTSNLIYMFLIVLQMALVTSLILFIIIKPLQSSPKLSLYLLTFIMSTIYFYFFKISNKHSKDSFKIYEDRIEFFNLKEPPEIDVINLSEIDQVRYEDDFGRSYSQDVSSKSFIYCYFKNGYKSKSKRIRKDRLKLFLSKDYDKEESVIKILQFFQKKKKQVYISTKSGKIKTALNLKSWTDPGIHPSIRL
jgi:hypothetical protein